MRLSAATLAEDPAQLTGQVIGRLQDEHDPALDGLLDQAASWSEESRLCSSAGALIAQFAPLKFAVRHTGLVTAVAVTADSRVISGGDDATLRVWDLDVGRKTARSTADSQVTAGATGLRGPLIVAVGEALGVAYTLRIQELREAHGSRSPDYAM